MKNKDILEYTLEDFKELVAYSHKENMTPPTPIVTYYRNDYDGPLFSIMLRNFAPEEKTVTFATAMMVNAILPIDKVAITMDASISKRTQEEWNSDEELPMPSEDPTSVDVVWTNVIERDGEVHSAGIEYSIEDKTGNLVWDKESQKQYEGVTKAETGGLITELVMGSFNADSKIMNKMADVKNDGERSVEYFTPLMTFLTAMDYIVMCSQYGDEFLKSLGITDTEFRTMDEYLKEMEEE